MPAEQEVYRWVRTRWMEAALRKHDLALIERALVQAGAAHDLAQLLADLTSQWGVQVTWKLAETHPVLELTSEDAEVRRGAVTADERAESLRKERDELVIQNEILKSRVAEERRTAARAQQQYDQLKVTLDKMVDDLRDRGKANETLQGALIARYAGRLCMHESYWGVVEQVHGDKVVVVYETEDDPLEQVYERSQFIDCKLLKVGDRVEVFVHVALRAPTERDAAFREEATEAPRKRRNIITDPYHEF